MVKWKNTQKQDGSKTVENVHQTGRCREKNQDEKNQAEVSPLAET